MRPPSPSPPVDEAEVASIAARVHAAATLRTATVLRGPVGEARLAAALAEARAALEADIQGQLQAEREVVLAEARAAGVKRAARVGGAGGGRVGRRRVKTGGGEGKA